MTTSPYETPGTHPAATPLEHTTGHLATDHKAPHLPFVTPVQGTASAGAPVAEEPAKPTIHEAERSLTMVEELAITKRFGRPFDGLATTRQLRALVFIQRVRRGERTEEALEAARTLSQKAALEAFRDEDLEVRAEKNTEFYSAVLERLDILQGALTDYDEAAIETKFAADYYELDLLDRVRAVLFCLRRSAGVDDTKAKQQVAALTRGEVLNEAVAADPEGKGATGA